MGIYIDKSPQIYLVKNYDTNIQKKVNYKAVVL